MNLLKKTYKLIPVILLFSCHPEPITVGTLNPNQTNAMMWADAGAGLASAELGPVSVAIAAAASIAYYYDHLEYLEPGGRQNFYEHTPFNYSVNSDSIGVDHNLICQTYLALNEPTFSFQSMKGSAKLVRPDLTEEIDMITTEYFQIIYNDIKTINSQNADSTIIYIKKFINLNNEDANILRNQFENLNSSSNNNNKLIVVNTILQNIETFSITNSEKVKLKNCIKIFKYSSILWKI